MTLSLIAVGSLTNDAAGGDLKTLKKKYRLGILSNVDNDLLSYSAKLKLIGS